MKIATRTAYGEALVELGEKYPEIVVLDADLSASTMTKLFAEKYPDRFYECGIAEANMTGMAAGMATCGLIPFINSFASFIPGRAYDQIRNSIAYPGLNVKIVGSHGGISVGEDGATHQMNEDIGLMRGLPGMMVVVPCDGNEMKLAVEALVKYKGSCYLRMSRLAVESITDQIPGYHFKLGKAAMLRDGMNVTIIATGITVQMSYKAAEILESEGISARVIDMHTIKPLDEEAVLRAAEETGCILTVEEANIIGGLGSAVSEFLGENYPVPILRHGIHDEFGHSGKAEELLVHYGLTPEGIAEKAKSLYSRKMGVCNDLPQSR